MARKRTSENELVVSSGIAAAPVRRKPTSATHKKHALTQPETESASAVKPVTEPATQPAVATEPTREAVAALAYTYWAGRGYRGGNPEEDWLRAEREISAGLK
jgi:Protein of unknown function (DUF2934)